MFDIMNLFGEYTLYVYAGVAILLVFYKVEDKPLYKYLLDKFNEGGDKKPQPQPEPLTLAGTVDNIKVESPKVVNVEPVEMLRVSEGVRAVGITLVNQDLSKLSIENYDKQKV